MTVSIREHCYEHSSDPAPAMDNLPYEIIQLISEYLSAQDLLNARLSCKTLGHRFHKLYNDAFYETRTYYLMRPSLEILLKVSESCHGRRVKHIKFDLQTPYPNIDHDICLEDDPAAVNTRIIPRGVSKLLIDQCQRHHESGDDTVLINTAFANLQNLRTIELIYDNRAPSARTLNLYLMMYRWNYISCSMARHFVNRKPAPGVSLARHFFTILLAAATNCIPLERFFFDNIEASAQFGPMDRLSDAHFYLLSTASSPFKSSHPNLKELDICLDDLSNSQVAEGGHAYFYNFISFFNRSLETLRISHVSIPTADINQSLRACPKLPRFRHLHTLSLHNMASDFENLSGFLRSFRSTLECLTFNKYRLQDGWQAWPRILALLKREFQLYYFFLDACSDGPEPIPLMTYLGDWEKDALFSVYPDGKERHPVLYRKVVKALDWNCPTGKFWAVVTGKAPDDRDNSDDFIGNCL